MWYGGRDGSEHRENVTFLLAEALGQRHGGSGLGVLTDNDAFNVTFSNIIVSVTGVSLSRDPQLSPLHPQTQKTA